MVAELYPLTFHPIYKPKIWGGYSLNTVLKRDLPAGLIGESWDVAAHANGVSVVDRGALAGWNLEELVREFGAALLGEAGINSQGKFPLLLKLIAAEQDLSIQVHPDDDYVRGHTGEAWGKNELWYVIHSDPGAWIIWGQRPGVGREEFRVALKKGGEAILACLNKVTVRPGEVYPISSGLIHALGAGVLVAEIQQNSDTTYRLYDWDRLDEQGKPRELHLAHALKVIDFSPQVLDRDYQLARCARYFRLNVLKALTEHVVDLGDSLQILTALEKPAQILWQSKSYALNPGQSCLLPAALERCLLSTSGVVLQARLGLEG